MSESNGKQLAPTVWQLHPDKPPSPPEIVRAVAEIMQVLERLSPRSYDQVWRVLSDVILNCATIMQWESSQQRDFALLELVSRVSEGLALLEDGQSGTVGSA
jgi:curved DNA-binding protein CbpA